MEKRHGAFAAGGLLAAFLTFGGVWQGVVRLVPAGVPRSIVVIGLGIAFVAVYVGLLVERVRKILGGTRTFLRDASILLAELALLLLAFAGMYSRLGILDNTQQGSPVVHDLWTALYYSIVTFTTLGYGDFYPVGLGRPLAALEALTGYLVLGVLASTAASVLSPHDRAGWLREEDGEDD